VFGLQGAFLGTTSSFPPSTSPTWTLFDREGHTTGLLTFPISSRPVPAPDGNRIAFLRGSGSQAVLIVRMVGSGDETMVTQGPAGSLEWADATHVRVVPTASDGAIATFDVQSLQQTDVFRPPPAPTTSAISEWQLGGSRWATLSQWDTTGTEHLHEWLFDRQTSQFVRDLLPYSFRLAPNSDGAAGSDGSGKFAVGRICSSAFSRVSLGGAPETPVWSADGHFVAAAVGGTSDEIGPRQVAVIDVARGLASIVATPWGSVGAWSSDGKYVVLERRGTHSILTRVAAWESAP
jgi:hypothetical protein